VHRDRKLLQVVAAAGTGGRLADFLHGGQKHSDQRGVHHQQFDERESRHGELAGGSVVIVGCC